MPSSLIIGFFMSAVSAFIRHSGDTHYENLNYLGLAYRTGRLRRVNSGSGLTAEYSVPSLTEGVVMSAVLLYLAVTVAASLFIGRFMGGV
jgi:hypothetical protein